ncbi:TAT-variant-translocated molybdopterin oxidoreductase [Pseudobdellovibrio exovorus]|uniref:Molybdopterin oxidoreductase, iron-sulfur binding subunit n=1 Tax=Pseudobdellovibrio exovorus JSS TaxID=1184267 RepID=M4V8J9_9BACT|nr:TAT-variant-translocated molybdopterin oxidoreductase [Pseudobdellovibrio exovorus]AGH95727.1 molybdopterin oxidoreductase, iron-sulfur binding subunit [Pseudobdellovibrio exovorus JSS]
MKHESHDHSHADHADKKNNRPVIERDRTYWKSFEDLNDTPEFRAALATEFMSSPLREESANEGDGDKWHRREFLKLMGASVALTTAAGCIRRPVQKIVPYNKQPEEVVVGMSNWYTSAYFDGQEGLGLLIKSREGRPVHIEGNPNNPLTKGAVSSRAQASLLGLYDPERLQGPKRNLLNEKRTNKETVSVSWDDLDNKVVAELKKGSVYILSGNISSPATQAVIDDFGKAFGSQHVVWEPLANDDVVEGQKAAYGEAVVPAYRFDRAKMIVSVDADFLGTWLTPVNFTRQFTDGRKNIETMNRLVSFDSTYSLTGANADIRYRIKPSQQLTVVMGLISEVIGSTSYASSEALKAALAPFKTAAADLKISEENFKKVAADLIKNAGESLVVAGGIQTRTEDSLNLQVAVNFLNTILGNEGKTVLAKKANNRLKASYDSLIDLVKKMNAGSVKTLIIYRSNPLYALSKDVGFAEALKNVPTVVYAGDTMDETAQFSHYVATDNHALETWGDVEFSSGVYSIQQPLIRTMYDTRSFQLSLMTWAYLANQGPKRLVTYETYYDYLRAFWKEEMAPKLAKGRDFETFWSDLLQSGVVGEAESSASARSFRTEAFTAIKKKNTGSELELALYPTVQIGDGTLANVAWLQELPDPVTKIVWDNYASVSIKTAERLKLKQGDIVELKVGDKKLNIPLHIQPGLHDEVVAISVGYGRTKAGRVGNGIGQDAYQLSSVVNNHVVFAGLALELKKTGKRYDLVTTQGHDSMEGRQIVVQATNKDYAANKQANIHRHHTWSIWSGHQYNGHKWGMAIDLNTCTGCSACVTACQSENNIHVVGKKYVMQGREMHWLRIDRYYTGDIENAEAVFQPVMCQHCDNAPCETVCPVAATVHSSEGLNEMVYNRCVGTRYCANNCPYKVRRFNWFNYAKLIEKPMHMALNPEVMVRPRGVMEKCTFCVQRIKEAKNKAKNDGRALKDGDVKVACQTACPTGGIIFGDLNDENSAVAKAFKAEPRSYALLEEWYAKPSVRYMTKIRNNDQLTPKKDGHHAGTQNNESVAVEGGQV